MLAITQRVALDINQTLCDFGTMYDPDGPLVTTLEAAGMRGVSNATINRWIREGRLTVVMRIGKNQLLRSSDVMDLQRPQRGRPRQEADAS